MSGIITELFVRRNHGTKTGRVSYDSRHELLDFFTTSSPSLSILSRKQRIIDISRRRTLQMIVLTPSINCKRFFTTKRTKLVANMEDGTVNLDTMKGQGTGQMCSL